MPVERFPLDLNVLVQELADSSRATAGKAGVSLEAEPVFGPLYIEGDTFASLEKATHEALEVLASKLM